MYIIIHCRPESTLYSLPLVPAITYLFGSDFAPVFIFKKVASVLPSGTTAVYRTSDLETEDSLSLRCSSTWLSQCVTVVSCWQFLFVIIHDVYQFFTVISLSLGCSRLCLLINRYSLLQMPSSCSIATLLQFVSSCFKDV